MSMASIRAINVDDEPLARRGLELRLRGAAPGAADQHADGFPEVLPIRLGRETVRLPVASIKWVDAAGDYMCVDAEGRTHIVRATMKQFEERLDPADFQRVHRSTVVNIRRIRKLKPHTNGEYFLILDGGHELKLSRSYRDRLERILGKG